MLQVVNQTPLAATLTVFPDPQGVECAYANVKASFDFRSGEPLLAAQQANFLAADVYWGEPGKSSLRAAGDVTLLKPATDVIVIGRAIAQGGATQSMEVRLQVGPVQRQLRIYGNRHWVARGKGEFAISEPEPFERMPLRWELAYGGIGALQEGRPQEGDARNPLGRGFIASHDDKIAGQALPNIEDPAMLITAPHDRPAPAGIAPVAPTWSVRSQYAGTYDEAWQRERAPHLPLDFDPRFFNVAAPGMVAPGYLQGGEEVSIVGCSAGAPLRFRLPRLDLRLEWLFNGKAIAAIPVLDTVLFETDVGRLQMVWRAALRVDKNLLKLRELRVACTNLHMTAEAP
ncbi:DUF2169 domain-containing protein [Uliginosibacterium sp. H3]|uniref:DUF2169 domain-containing protein n=1 Tax=Uliginosibacterium silvisoli TaxID=3114758 RepID=A0ABU6K4F3_9RHOO|nr:DUF2169 domain-containing protein [Uliginosibacterium sp. H3]